MKKAMQKSLVLAAALCGLTATAFAQDVAVTKEDVNIGKKQYSPYLYQSYPNRVFWGDTHLHTSYSTISSSGVPARLIKPLDFLVVSDAAWRATFTKSARADRSCVPVLTA